MAWLQKRGGVWWVGYRLDGRQYRNSTGAKTRAKAEVALAKVESMEIARKSGVLTAEYFNVVTGRRIERVRLDAFVDQWIKDAEERVGKPTLNKYKQLQREFLDATNARQTGLLLEDVTPEHISQFFSQKRKKSSASTVKGFRRILSSVFIDAANRGHTRGNPVAVVKVSGRKDEEQNERRPFTLSEVQDLYAKASPFWRYMITAGFYTGQSLGDLITLKRANVDLEQNLIQMTRRKTRQRVNIPLAKPLRDLLVSIWPKQDDAFFWPKQAERYLKVGPSPFSQEFFKLLASIGLVVSREDKQSTGRGRSAKRKSAGLGFHNLRHTFVTSLKIGGAVDSIAKELAGHRSASVNTHYTHLPVETLAKAVSALPEFNAPTEKGEADGEK